MFQTADRDGLRSVDCHPNSGPPRWPHKPWAPNYTTKPLALSHDRFGEGTEPITQTLHGTVIYAYIGVVWGVNVGIYDIHGVSGSWNGPTVGADAEVPPQTFFLWSCGWTDYPIYVNRIINRSTGHPDRKC